jgi:hypothetical protein
VYSKLVTLQAAIELRSLNEDSLLGPHPLWTLEKIKNTLELGDDDEDAEVCRRRTMEGQGDQFKVVFALFVTDTTCIYYS